jgi:TonB family protein
MREALGTALLEEPELTDVPELRLLVELESRPSAFFSNLRDIAFPRKLLHLRLDSAPAAFWPDVFVKRGLPWRRFLESGGYHIVALVLFVAFSRLLALQPKPVTHPTFDHSQVIYYQPSEYLPPLDTGHSKADPAQKADPEIARQPVISVPPEADNRSQTIVSAPNIKLKHDVPLPNIVSWADKTIMPIAPAPLVPASSITRIAPLQNSVVAPPPDLRANARALQTPQAAVIAPPVEADSTRRLGDLNIANTTVIAPAPQLPVSAQRAMPISGLAVPVAQVVPPPPSVAASGSPAGSGRVVALNLHPAVGAAPPDAAPGNRRGTFADTPEGHTGASGKPGSSSTTSSAATNSSGNGNPGNEAGSNGSGNRKVNDLPSGLYVGSAAQPKTSPIVGNPTAANSSHNSVNPNLVASLPPPRVTSKPTHTLEPGSASKLSEAERQVFGDRKFYALTLNMPNLNSAGGSWVIRFAELKPDANSDSTPSDLSAPAATHKVDPAYPLQLMRENVSGTVILSAIIHADGTVGNVRILRSIDDRIDQFASQAIAKWQFDPATKHGTPIDVEATFQIPFHPTRQRSNF